MMASQSTGVCGWWWEKAVTALTYCHGLIRIVCVWCDLTGSSEQHGSSASSNINVNLLTPEKVSSSTRRRFETQVCQSITPVTHTFPGVGYNRQKDIHNRQTDRAKPSHAADHETGTTSPPLSLSGCASQLCVTVAFVTVRQHAAFYTPPAQA